jgi:hypothetical protein
MLQHIPCPRCQAPNLTAEYVCFACGAALRPLHKRLRPAEAELPWVLWVGLVLALAILGLFSWQAVEWLVAYRERAALPWWYWLAAGGSLLVMGQVAFFLSHRSDRRWWRLKRAPLLPLAQARPGDVIWARGRVECETPLLAPYANQPCAYYHIVVRERETEEAGWRTVQRETNAVDFLVTQEADSVHVPSGNVFFDAPLYLDSYGEGSGNLHVRVWALPVGMPASVCGKLEAEGARPRLDAPGEEVPTVATWRSPEAYVTMLERQVRGVRMVGWAASMLGALMLLGGVARG